MSADRSQGRLDAAGAAPELGYMRGGTARSLSARCHGGGDSGDEQVKTSLEGALITPGVVEKHIASIFARLGLAPSDTGNRRVIAAIKYLESQLGGSQRSGSRCRGWWR